MADVKITLKKGETELDALEQLHKAYQYHAAGEGHEDAFHDSAPRDAFNKMINLHTKMQEKLMKEILDLLEEEVSNGNL